ncbi:MAG: hypothetical protein NC218_10595 [Acetobacter sp.]|nr:hypothetical protein [Acetobacter sp.]
MQMTTADTAISVAEKIEHEEIFYQSTEFWVSFAFIVVVVLLVSPLTKAVSGMMKQRINRIKSELQTAENLKLEAQKLYAEYERKFQNTENEVNTIIENEKTAIAEEKERKMHALEVLLKQKNIEAEAKIEMAAMRVNNEINAQISDRTMEILKNIFQSKINENEHRELINRSLKNLEAIKIND